jgi:hypothetical protein
MLKQTHEKKNHAVQSFQMSSLTSRKDVEIRGEKVPQLDSEFYCHVPRLQYHPSLPADSRIVPFP